jgi:hypothetical protein
MRESLVDVALGGIQVFLNLIVAIVREKHSPKGIRGILNCLL